jgi:hypothetical protein
MVLERTPVAGNAHGYEWRAPQLEGRREQQWLGERGQLKGEWVDHPLGHTMPYAYPFRTCGYCGSMHPDDLLGFLVPPRGVLLNEADWKYGWPHKFYVEGIPNPLAGMPICSGGRGGPDAKDHAIGTGPATTHAKFYTEHLADATDLDALAAAFTLQVPNITFLRDDAGKVMWRGMRGSGVR